MANSLLQIPRRAAPSFKAGYARSAAESANPGLWVGLRHALVPNLGITGNTVFDIIGNVDGTLGGSNLPTWKIGDKGESLYIAYDTVWPPNQISPASIPTYGNAMTVVATCNSLSTASVTHVVNNKAVALELNSTLLELTWFGLTDQYIWTTLGYDPRDGVTRSYAASWDGTNKTNYVDGSIVQQQTTTGTLDYSGNARRIATDLEGNFYSAYIWDRALDDSEIALVAKDPLAPFRLKNRVISYAPATPPATTTKLISIPYRAKPSYKSGYARSAAESANPGLWDGLVGAWIPALGDTGLSTLPDISGRWNDGTLNGSMTSDDWVVNKNGHALDFDGSDDYINCGNATIDFSHGTISILAESLGTGLKVYAEISPNASFNRILFYRNSTDLILYLDSVAVATVTAALVSAMTLITATWNINTDTYEIYLDGVAQNAGSAANNDITTVSRQMTIGTSYTMTGFFHQGEIGSTYVHNRVLSSTEIQQLSQDPLAPFRLKNRIIAYSTGAAPSSYAITGDSISGSNSEIAVGYTAPTYAITGDSTSSSDATIAVGYTAPTYAIAGDSRSVSDAAIAVGYTAPTYSITGDSASSSTAEIAVGYTAPTYAITGNSLSASDAAIVVGYSAPLMPITGDSVSSSEAAVSLATSYAISGDSASSSTASITVGYTAPLMPITGESVSSSTASAVFTTIGVITGDSVSSSIAEISVVYVGVGNIYPIAGDSVSSSTTEIALATIYPITGDSASSSSSSADLTTLHKIIGKAISASSATIDLAGGSLLFTPKDILGVKSLSRTSSVTKITRTLSIAVIPRSSTTK